MNKELIINTAPSGIEIAFLEDKKLVELHNDKTDANFAVGDLYLGKVKKLIPGLNAAFVDVGFEKDAFLHYTDLSPYIRSLLKFTEKAIDVKQNPFDFSAFDNEPEIIKTGKINGNQDCNTQINIKLVIHLQEHEMILEHAIHLLIEVFFLHVTIQEGIQAEPKKLDEKVKLLNQGFLNQKSSHFGFPVCRKI